MNNRLLTPERINALSHLSRWRGWTKRPYSVLEHCCVGANVLQWFKWSSGLQRKWWLHDLHETEIVGDVPTPDKHEYMNQRFDIAVEEFDTALGNEVEFGPKWWRDKTLKKIDRCMLLVENDQLATRKDPLLCKPDYNDPMVTGMYRLIDQRVYDDQAKAVTKLWMDWTRVNDQ